VQKSLASQVRMGRGRELWLLDSVLEFRQGDHWLVVPPGYVAWIPRPLALIAMHRTPRAVPVRLSIEAARRLPPFACTFRPNDLLRALLRRLSRGDIRGERLALREAVVVDELLQSEPGPDSVLMAGALAQLAGTTLGTQAHPEALRPGAASRRVMKAADLAHGALNQSVQVRLGMILRTHQWSEDAIAGVLGAVDDPARASHPA